MVSKNSVIMCCISNIVFRTNPSSGNACVTLSIPASMTSSVVFVASSSQPYTSSYGVNPSFTRLIFFNNALQLPGSLSFVDDLFSGGAPQIPYRYKKFSTFDQYFGWAFGNSAPLFGGVFPSTWSDQNGGAYQMSFSFSVLRAFLTQKGQCDVNCNIVSDSVYRYSSTNGDMMAVLFRVSNTGANAIIWTPTFYFSAFSSWGELASISVNGALTWNAANAGTVGVGLSIPGNMISSVIFVVGGSAQSGPTGFLHLAFFNNGLQLPNGLTFVDDLTD